jgi:sigma-B regulation protein RsbU (phosphoserine phosphatase)
VLRVGKDGTLLGRVGKGAYPLGIKTELSWETESGRLGAGDLLLLCSDGVTEAHDAGGNEFGEGRLAACLPRVASLSAAEIVEAVAGDVWQFRGRKTPEDDVSIAALRFTG